MTTSTLELTSPAFDEGERMPDRHAWKAENVNPTFEVDGVPEGTETFALVIDDPDAEEATGKVFDHWVIWNIDGDVREIPPGFDDGVEGENGLGETGFLGFAPPDAEHTYQIRLYALDAELDLPAGSTKAELQEAMADHVLAETLLQGRFAPEQTPDDGAE